MGGLELQCTQSVRNGLDETIDVLTDLGHPEPNHAKAHLAQPVISPGVVDELIAVLVAIDFDPALLGPPPTFPRVRGEDVRPSFLCFTRNALRPLRG
jgi:hypothetical protein